MIKVKSLEVREIEYAYDKRPKIKGMDDVVMAVKPLIADPNKEFFMALYLNTKNGVLKQEVISIGSLNANIVHPREIFKTACMISASSIIVAHNHPSGDPTPSREDIEITKKLHEAGKMMLSTRNYITNCSHATPSIWSDLTMACVLSNEEV